MAWRLGLAMIASALLLLGGVLFYYLDDARYERLKGAALRANAFTVTAGEADYVRGAWQLRRLPLRLRSPELY
ncbi:MAG TPA: hypothetical protein VNN09_09445, partial [Candidatus Competibacteraceae bacterium]|nr:hypothetical protein [Candidatus Competibacteraceae bacterium]